MIQSVVLSLLVAFSRIRPGISCTDADAAARSVITEGGFGQYFTHRLGHGIGLELHEDPYLVHQNEFLLEVLYCEL